MVYTSSTAATEREASVPVAPARLTANLLGIPFGLAGLAQGWTTAHDFIGLPAWPAAVLWIVATGVYLAVAGAYLRYVIGARRAGAEPADLTFGPFTALIFVVPMMLGAELAESASLAGRIIFLIFLALVALYGGGGGGEV